MKFLLLLSITLTFSLSEVIDLGVDGHLYDIKETNLMETIKDAVDNLDLDEKTIKSKIKEEVEKQAFGTTDLPYIKEYKTYSEINYQILTEDITNPLGRVFKKKGDKIIMDNPIALDICYVDGTNKIMLKNQIDYFDKVVKKKSGINAECVYMVSNRSVLELNREYYPRVFYPSRKVYEDRFMVKSIPTYLHAIGKKRYMHSFPISMFKHEVK